MANPLVNDWTRWDYIPNPQIPWDAENGAGTAAPWVNQFDFGRLGFASAYPEVQQGGGDGDYNDMGVSAAARRAELEDWIRSKGYTMGTMPTYNGGHIQALLNSDGSEVEGTRWEKEAPDDSAFWATALAAGALVGGAAGGLWGGSGAEVIGAADAGIGAFPSGMEGWGFAPTSASTGGTAGGWAAGLDPLAAAGGGSSGIMSTIGNALSGFSGNGWANLAQAGIGLYGQNKALKAMQGATNQSNEFNQRAFDQIRADNKPLMDLRDS
ncbi:MAG: hypothetical protein ACRC1H_11150, partial [Caldilineaceae bacterium]